MPDKEKTNNKTITIKEGIDLFVIFTSNRESKLSVIVKDGKEYMDEEKRTEQN